MPSVRTLLFAFFFLCVAAGLLGAASPSQSSLSPSPGAYLGFDRNDYPGDDALPGLRQFFSFTSYWLSPPPGGKQSSWLGKRPLLQSQGFGFVVLFAAKESREIKTPQDALRYGNAQAADAARLARQEGFPPRTVIFLDVEEGGRLPDLYHQYLLAWYQSLTQAGFELGVYCSGFSVQEAPGISITTADDIQSHLASRRMVFWVYKDSCPPSPGCSVPSNPPPPANSGIPYASIWQFVRSPRDKQDARQCSGYASDGNCYPPSGAAHKWFLDLNVATSPNPSAPQK